MGPQQKQCTGAHTNTTTHRNKTVNVYKIKHVYIVLVFPTKSVFKPQKNIQYTTYIDKHGAPKLEGPLTTAPRAHALRRH
jgi:hypothetical protein